MSAVTVSAFAAITAVLAVFLKKYNSEYSVIITVCACSIIILYIADTLIESVSGIKQIFDKSGMSESYMIILFKCVGICFLTEFSSDTCKDAGQASLANIVTLSGRIFVLISALPLFSQLITTVSQLTGG